MYVDGKSNLVIKAFKEGNTYYGGKVNTTWEGGVGHLGSPDQVRVPDAGAWPAFWLSSDAGGEIDVVEWYGNGNWPSATTVAPWRTARNGRRRTSPWTPPGTRGGSVGHGGMRFWKDYTDGAAPYFDVPADSMEDWPFNNPGYKVFPIFNLAVAGSGGDPSGGTYPVQMLVDWIRVW